MAVSDRWHTRKPRIVDGKPVPPCKAHSKGSTVLYPLDVHGQGDRWQVRYRDEEGKQKSRNFAKRGGTKAEVDPEQFALAYDAKVRADLNARTYTDPTLGSVTLETYAKQWRANLAASTNSLVTIDKRLAHIYDVEAGPKSRRAQGSSPIGSASMAELAKKPSAIQQWIKSLERKGLGANYIGQIADTLSSIFIAAMDDGVVARNPLRAKSVTLPTPPERLIVPWTAPMVVAAAESLGERDAGIAYLGAGAALRQGEIFGIAEDDIEFLGRKRMIHVRRQVMLVDKQLVFSLPKGDKVRDVPLSDELGLRLAAQIQACPPAPVTLPWETPAGKPHTVKLLFVRPDGNPHCHQTFVHRWHKARRAAGATHTPENGMHILRHTAASAWLAGGVDIKRVSAWLGHKDPGFTLRTYIHLMPGDEDQGRSAMDAFFQSGESKINNPRARNVHGEGPG